MTAIHWRDLVVLSIKDPAEAARILLSLSLPREALWTALMLVAVLNTLLFTLTNTTIDAPSGLPAFLNAPSIYFLFVAGGLILVIYSLFWVGRAMGGQGSLHDIMVLLIWLQGLRVGVQALVFLLMLTMPLLAVLLLLAAAVLGIWILVNFIDQAHRFASLGRATGVMIAAFVAMVLGLSFLLSLLGVSVVGGAGYV